MPSALPDSALPFETGRKAPALLFPVIPNNTEQTVGWHLQARFSPKQTRHLLGAMDEYQSTNDPLTVPAPSMTVVPGTTHQPEQLGPHHPPESDSRKAALREALNRDGATEMGGPEEWSEQAPRISPTGKVNGNRVLMMQGEYNDTPFFTAPVTAWMLHRQLLYYVKEGKPMARLLAHMSSEERHWTEKGPLMLKSENGVLKPEFGPALPGQIRNLHQELGPEGWGWLLKHLPPAQREQAVRNLRETPSRNAERSVIENSWGVRGVRT